MVCGDGPAKEIPMKVKDCSPGQRVFVKYFKPDKAEATVYEYKVIDPEHSIAIFVRLDGTVSNNAAVMDFCDVYISAAEAWAAVAGEIDSEVAKLLALRELVSSRRVCGRVEDVVKAA